MADTITVVMKAVAVEDMEDVVDMAVVETDQWPISNTLIINHLNIICELLVSMRTARTPSFKLPFAISW